MEPERSNPFEENPSHSETKEAPTFLISLTFGRKVFNLNFHNISKITWWNITDFIPSTITTFKRYTIT